MRRRKLCVALLASLLLETAAPSIIPGVEITAEAAKINKKSATLIKGKTLQLKVSGANGKITWSSSRKSVATVNSKGKVTAKKKGTATITAKIGKKKYTCKVRVETPKMSKSKLTMVQGKTAKLKLSGNTQKVKWTSSNKKIATVNSSGTIKAVRNGRCRIYATVSGKKYYCTVTVKKKDIPVTSFYLNDYSITIPEGTSKTVGYTIYPSDATDKTVKWSVSNKNIATVNSSGKITGKSIGQTVLTAVCDGKKRTCTVSVVQDFNEADAKKNLRYSSYKTDRGIVVVIKNNYKYPVDVDVTSLFYNSEKILIGKGTDLIYHLESGKEYAVFCRGPLDSSYDEVDYSSYEVVLDVSETDEIGYSDEISMEGNFGVDNVMVTVSNTGVSTDYTMVAIVFYKNGAVVGYDYTYADVDESGQTDYIEFDFPYDKNYDDIIPDSFKLYKLSYAYNW